MMKKKKKPRRATDAQIELDHEVIADLAAPDAELDAVRGGVRPSQNCRAATGAG
jgi:hypothetical protein